MTTTKTDDITTTVTREVALELVRLAGGEPSDRGGYNLNGRHYWQLDETLMHALVEITDNDLGR